MVKNLVTKSAFARLAGVSPAAITKACGSSLKAALTGKRLDTEHVNAVEYLAKQREDQLPPPATGIDPLYEKAVASGAKSRTAIQRELKVSWDRATRLVDMMKAAGVFRVEPPPEPAQPRAVSGQEKARTTKKVEALDRLVNRGETIHKIPDNIQAFADMTLRELIKRFGTETAFCDWLTATKSIEQINEKRLKNAEAEGKLVSRQLVKVGVIDPIDSAHIKLLTDGAKTIARRTTAMHDGGQSLDDIEKFVQDQITSFIRPVKAKVARALRNA